MQSTQPKKWHSYRWQLHASRFWEWPRHSYLSTGTFHFLFCEWRAQQDPHPSWEWYVSIHTTVSVRPRTEKAAFHHQHPMARVKTLRLSEVRDCNSQQLGSDRDETEKNTPGHLPAILEWKRIWCHNWAFVSSPGDGMLGLTHPRQMLYHWATPMVPVKLLRECCCPSSQIRVWMLLSWRQGFMHLHDGMLTALDACRQP